MRQDWKEETIKRITNYLRDVLDEIDDLVRVDKIVAAEDTLIEEDLLAGMTLGWQARELGVITIDEWDSLPEEEK